MKKICQSYCKCLLFTSVVFLSFPAAQCQSFRPMVFREHINNIYIAEFSPDGKYIVTLSQDNFIRIWDVVSGKPVQKFYEGDNDITAICYSRKGNHLAALSSEKIIVWDMISFKKKWILKKKDVSSFDFSDDGNYLCLANGNQTEVISMYDGGQKFIFRYGFCTHLNTAFGADSTNILVTTTYNNVLLIKFYQKEGHKGKNLKGKYECSPEAIFSPDNKTILTYSFGKTAYVWNSDKGKKIFNLKGHKEDIIVCAYSPDSRYIAAASKDSVIRIRDASKGKTLHVLNTLVDFGQSMNFSPDGKFLLVRSRLGVQSIWEVETEKLMYVLEKNIRCLEHSMFSPDGKKIIAVTINGTFAIWDALTGKLLVDVMLVDSNDFACFHPSGLYDVTPGAADFIYYANGLEVIENNKVKEKYFEPALWDKIMKGEKLRIVK